MPDTSHRGALLSQSGTGGFMATEPKRLLPRREWRTGSCALLAVSLLCVGHL